MVRSEFGTEQKWPASAAAPVSAILMVISRESTAVVLAMVTLCCDQLSSECASTAAPTVRNPFGVLRPVDFAGPPVGVVVVDVRGCRPLLAPTRLSGEDGAAD